MLVAAILAGSLVSAAAGRSGGVVPLQLGGALYLSGSHIRCGSGKDVKGVTLVDCEIVDASDYPKRGSYIVLMEANGRVNVTNESTLKTVFDRKPAAVVQARAKTIIHPGDRIELPGTSTISCNASLVGRKPTIFCYYVDKKGVVRAHSYSFAISDTIVTTLGWDAKGHASVIHSWPENG